MTSGGGDLAIRMSFSQAIEVLTEHELACEVCRYDGLCRRGVTGGPNGPIYPPCCDTDLTDLLHEDEAIELAEEICNDV